MSDQSGRTPSVGLQCSCLRWTARAFTFEQLGRLAASHDDSPSRRHVVLLDPVGPWPKDADAFAALLSAPARVSSATDGAT